MQLRQMQTAEIYRRRQQACADTPGLERIEGMRGGAAQEGGDHIGAKENFESWNSTARCPKTQGCSGTVGTARSGCRAKPKPQACKEDDRPTKGLDKTTLSLERGQEEGRSGTERGGDQERKIYSRAQPLPAACNCLSMQLRQIK